MKPIPNMTQSRRIQRLKSAASVSALLISIAASHAAPITWGTPTTVTSENDIKTNGTIVHAGRWGGGAVTVTVGSENIVFADRSISALGTQEAAITQGSGGEQQNTTLFNTTGLTIGDADFTTMMRGNCYENGDPAPQEPTILSLQGPSGAALINGWPYQIQIFFSDDRAGSAARAQRYSDSATEGAGNLSASFLDSTSPYVVGTFTADAATQNIYVWNTDGSANYPAGVSGYVLRKLVPPNLFAVIDSLSPSNSAYAGEARVLSGSTSGGTPTGYQWEWDNGSGGVSFSAIPGANGLTYTQDTTGLLGAYQYRFIATNLVTASTSSVVTLTVSAATIPVIVTDTTPSSATAYTTYTVSFRAAFDGNHPIAYQWQVDKGTGFTNIPSATSNVLTLANLQLTGAGSYQLTATNSIGGAVSTPATLIVNDSALAKYQWQTPVPFSSLNADQILTNLPGTIVDGAAFGGVSNSIVLGNGRIVHFGVDGSIATASGNGTAAGAFPAGTGLTTSNANFDAVLNRFTWDGGPKTITLNNLVVGEQYSVQLFGLDDRNVNGTGGESNRLANFQDPSDSADISATFKMGDNVYVVGTFWASNTTETIQMNLPTGNNGSMNALVLRALSFTPAAQPPTVSGTTSQTAFQGRAVTFVVTAASYVIPTYQWQAGPVSGPYTNLSNGGIISGANTDTLTIADASPYAGAEFRCHVSNPAGSVDSAAGLLTTVALPVSSGAASTAVLALSPVAYWPLNETNDVSGGGIPALDAAGTHDGTYLTAAQNAFNGIVGVQAADGFGLFATNAGALGCTGVDQDWVTTPPLNLNTNTVTISLWIYPNGVQSVSAGLFVNRNSGTVAGLSYRLDRLGYKWNNDAPETYNFDSGLVIPTNTWSFVALVVEPTQATFYLYNTNGLQTATNVVAHNNMSWGGNAADIRIGCNNNGALFNGTIDEVAIFNRALTPAEVSHLMTVAVPTLGIQPVGSNVQLTWTGGILLEATSLNGPWTTNANTSPYLVAPAVPQKFYRVKAQ